MSSGSIKNHIITVLKILLAASALTWAVKSGYLDLDQLHPENIRWPWFIAAFVVMIFEVVLAALRWHLMLQAFEIQTTFRIVHTWTWIGQFSSIFLPGLVGGDAIRLLMVIRNQPERKAMATFTVLLDRAMGLFALLLISGIAVFFLPADFHQTLPWIYVLPWVLLFGMLTGLLMLVIVKKRTAWTDKLADHLPTKVRAPLTELRRNSKWPLYLGTNGILAIFSHLGVVLIFYFLIRALGYSMEDVGYSKLVLAVPLGLLAMSLPLAPAGVGVGQVAMALIFMGLGISEKSLGAASISLFQILGILVNFLGILPFLFRQKEYTSVE